ALTFLPAMMALLGRGAFYPATPQVGKSGPAGVGFWKGVARLVSRRPRTVWLVTLASLLAAASFVPQLRASGVPESEFVLGYSEARSGEEVRERYFAAGVGTPAIVMGTPERAQELLAAVEAVDGVQSATITVSDSTVP